MTTGSEFTESVEEERPRESGTLTRGDVLGRYEILFPIATGGMATVYAARLVGAGLFQKPVALKRMLPHLARDPRFVTMFMDEAALCSRVQSPHVVSVIELSRHDDETLFMALELVVGVTLRELFEACEQAGRAMSMRVACALLVQAALGLHDAHEACSADGKRLGIVHRDISPHNVLVGIDGRARISDFGIARAVERLSATQTGELKGKLPYFSPEQMRCADLDARSDVFSLGIVAWELFAGQRLFAANNPLATAQAVASKPVARLDAVRTEVPASIAEVVAQALDRDLSQRTPSAESFAVALRQAAEASCGIADAREVTAMVRSLCGPSVARIEQALAQTMSEPTSPRKVRRKRRALPSHWALLLLAGAALGAGTLLAAGSGKSSDQVRQTPAPLTAQGKVSVPVRSESAATAAAPTVSTPLAERPAIDLTAQHAALPAATDGVSDAGSTTNKPVRSKAARKRASVRRRLEASKPVSDRATSTKARAATADKQPASGALLRGIDEFDQEREH